MQALANGYWFWLLLFAGLAVLYFLPSLIGLGRGVDHVGLVVVINVLGGATGVGWLGALILAFGPKRRAPELIVLPEAYQEFYPLVGVGQRWPSGPYDQGQGL